MGDYTIWAVTPNADVVNAEFTFYEAYADVSVTLDRKVGGYVPMLFEFKFFYGQSLEWLAQQLAVVSDGLEWMCRPISGSLEEGFDDMREQKAHLYLTQMLGYKTRFRINTLEVS